MRTPLKRAAIRAAVPATVVALILAGCTAQDDSSSTSPTSTTADTGTGTGTTIPASTDADLTVESAMAQNTAPHEGDASYDESAAVDVTLADGSSSSSSDAVSVDGDTVTIAAGGTYRLSGTLTDGQVVVTAADQDVTLVLDGVDLTSSTTSPLQVLEADDVLVVLADGSDNGLDRHDHLRGRRRGERRAVQRG
ncbi:MAG: carbohydrate-binding domain-containing protein [Cellulomonas sp.]|nr:carbohydrate-binding domain-containing protein [Cellulomonas sp.]MCR6704407.1 carbohydrate-binding domain-containing protein [Cellulomonas sp.]